VKNIKALGDGRKITPRIDTIVVRGAILGWKWSKSY